MSELLACQPNGDITFVPNTYEGIKRGLNGATLDFLSAGETGMYIDDDGMVDGLALNVPASLMFGIALYGPIVLCAGRPDDNGDTLPASSDAVSVLSGIAGQWNHVVVDAARKGQSVEVRADAGNVPPPVVVGLSDEQFARFLETGEIPHDE